jgi:four helix bundle protein
MQKEETDLAARTKSFAPQIIRLFSRLPKTTEAQILGKQLLRSGTSVGANYREAYRGRSKAEFVSKCVIVCEKSRKQRIGWICSQKPT